MRAPAGGHCPIGVTHDSKDALDLFSRESRAPGVSFAPGTTSGSALTLNSRPPVEPLHKLFTCLVPKDALAPPTVMFDDERHEVAVPTEGASAHAYVDRDVVDPISPDDRVGGSRICLRSIAHGRSGDKGDTSNIAIIARDPLDFEHLKEVLTVNRVRAHLGHLVKGPINRYEVPGIQALNFLMDQALDGGGPSSLRTDPMGKGMAQMLLELEIPRRSLES